MEADNLRDKTWSYLSLYLLVDQDLLVWDCSVTMFFEVLELIFIDGPDERMRRYQKPKL